MKETIPTSRLIFYGLLLGILPLLFVVMSLTSQLNNLSEMDERIHTIQEQILILGQKQAVNIALMQSYKDSDHFYIDKHLETIPLLESEIEALQKTMSNKNIAEDESIKRRYESLIGGENTLRFTEGVVQSSPFVQEVTETLIHSVEVDVEDIKEILAKVEGVQIGPYSPGPNRPQLIITDFKLEKKNVIDKNEVYQLNLKLLKREYL